MKLVYHTDHFSTFKVGDTFPTGYKIIAITSCPWILSDITLHEQCRSRHDCNSWIYELNNGNVHCGTRLNLIQEVT